MHVSYRMGNRHKGIGMNRPKKTKVEVPQLLFVRLKLNGFAVQVHAPPDQECESPAPCRKQKASLLPLLKNVVKAAEKWRAVRYCGLSTSSFSGTGGSRSSRR